ncbi:hypothetical protein BDD12DRAFT_865906 [Trichophaea hybrida]|nr:hypothetical protein BDD12DRAFT_865906 [Trichophaea hybrida]
MKCEFVQLEADRSRKHPRAVLKQEEPVDGNILYSQPPTNPIAPLQPVFGDSNYTTTTFPGTQAPTPETLTDGLSYNSSDSNPFGVSSPFGGFGRDAMHVDHPTDTTPTNARHPASRDVLNFGMMTNLELNEMDFGLLDSYNDMFVNTLGVPPMGFAQQQPPGAPPFSGPQTVQLALGVEAFQKSQWRWTPNQKDRGNSELGNLSIPPTVNPKIRVMNWRAVPGRLDHVARDRILAVLLTTCDFGDRLQAISSLPSAEMLDNLMNLYFYNQQQSIDTWIHPGTFQPSTVSPELLAAVVAAGAVLTTVPAVRKLGYALQEAVRIALPKLFEQNNSTTRDLHMLQAYMIQIEISLWSGNKRRIEIAESFRQPIGTMLRRSGKYRRAQYPPLPPSPSDTGEVLEKRWRAWTVQQQWSRLVYQLFIHDTQASISYQVNPIISYAELSLPFPESRKLFFACSATEWKNMYLSAPLSPNPRLPSFVDSLHEFPNLTIPLGARIDRDFAELATLYGLWGRIWDFRQRQAIRRTNERSSSPLLANIDKNVLAPRFSTPQCRLLLEVLAMTVYVSLEDLQSFAGKDEEEESIRVYPILQTWIQSSESRFAIWHAGQVLREARGFHRGQVTDFWAVAVYHAAITLWAYAALMSSSRRTTPLDVDVDDDIVILDGADMCAMERFVEYGRGKPRISSEAQLGDVDVLSPGAVMEVVCGLLMRFATDEEGQEATLPPLVENLVVLMEELGEAAERGR